MVSIPRARHATLLISCGLSLLLNPQSGIADRLQKNDPETQLLHVYQLMSGGQPDAALNAANQLVEQYPTFNLGHLVRGDLLMARARPVNSVGDTQRPDIAERLNDLRDEARGRFQAITNPPAEKMLPDVLVRLATDQKHVLVVDTTKARLYLFAHRDGELRYLTDYYVSIGKAGSDKVSTGDQKTPLGVYRINGTIPGNKLTDFYGKGALTLNYPNTWDQQRGRTGYGIWLHGVPSSAYNRPPKASNGCVVLANPDMESLMEKIQPGTHVVITNQIRWLSPAEWKTEQEKFLGNFLSNPAVQAKNPLLPAPETLSVFRYPANQQLIQVSYRGKDSHREQYWTLSGEQWVPASASSPAAALGSPPRKAG